MGETKDNLQRGNRVGLSGENDKNIHSFAVKVSVSVCLTNEGQTGRAVKREEDLSKQWSCSSDVKRTGLKSVK